LKFIRVCYNPHTMNLNTKVTQLKGVGNVFAKRLHKLGIHTAEDLLFHFPFRYEDYSKTIPIEELQEGQQVTIKAKIEIINTRRSPRKRTLLTEAVIADDTDQMKIVWFGQPYIKNVLSVGDMVYFSGKVQMGMLGKEMISPTYEKIQTGKETTHTARIVPMYPLTLGITQKQLRAIITQVIPLADQTTDWLPESILDQTDLIALPAAMKAIHFPETNEELSVAEKRLKFDELFLRQLRAERIRQSIKQATATQIPFDEEAMKQFVSTLPFILTKDQKVAAWEIFQDMQKPSPMNRLLEGDVGVGKTVVAAMAIKQVIDSGYQAALMAPTEILATQHFASIKKLLPDKRIVLLTGSTLRENNTEEHKKTKKQKRQDMLEALSIGGIDLIIGTHALLTEGVLFHNLALVIVDEQHRFGVEQRKTIRNKSGDPNTMPHFLSMTATPIPRSFALTVYGDLDLSIIRQKPVGRKDIKTRVVEPKNRQKAYDFIRTQVEQGRQVFVICPLIEQKEKEDEQPETVSEKKSVMSEYEKLQQTIFPTLRIEYLHGKMKSIEKEMVMSRFAHGDFDILVSTSVVEVGVDIPNASVMMIEDADRFGLAQLHQFRGRVGRGAHQSYCFLFTQSDSMQAIARLDYFEAHTDGFDVAEYDLEQRGPGEVYGVHQSGMGQFRLATMADIDLIKLARETARDIDFKKYPQLKKQVGEWEKKVHLE